MAHRVDTGATLAATYDSNNTIVSPRRSALPPAQPRESRPIGELKLNCDADVDPVISRTEKLRRGPLETLTANH